MAGSILLAFIGLLTLTLTPSVSGRSIFNCLDDFLQASKGKSQSEMCDMMPSLVKCALASFPRQPTQAEIEELQRKIDSSGETDCPVSVQDVVNKGDAVPDLPVATGQTFTSCLQEVMSGGKQQVTKPSDICPLLTKTIKCLVDGQTMTDEDVKKFQDQMDLAMTTYQLPCKVDVRAALNSAGRLLNLSFLQAFLLVVLAHLLSRFHG